ncbi:MAG: hypothetical protein ACI86M_002610 [Saprospiraceae bacterium]|jgi:hypothetical protein
MMNQNYKYLIILILIILANSLKAEVDTTKSKIEFEINSEFLLGQSIFITQEDVVNLNRTYGLGIQVGYELNQSHVIKIGIAFNKSFYDFRIVKRNLISSSGQLVDIQEYKEVVNISNASLGFIYSVKIENNFFLDFEILSFRLFSEQRKRENLPTYQNEGLIERGINLATDEYYLGLRTRCKYSINSHVKLGINLLFSNEKINLSDINNDSKFNLFWGTSISYKI